MDEPKIIAALAALAQIRGRRPVASRAAKSTGSPTLKLLGRDVEFAFGEVRVVAVDLLAAVPTNHLGRHEALAFPPTDCAARAGKSSPSPARRRWISSSRSATGLRARCVRHGRGSRARMHVCVRGKEEVAFMCAARHCSDGKRASPRPGDRVRGAFRNPATSILRAVSAMCLRAASFTPAARRSRLQSQAGSSFSSLSKVMG